MLCNNLFWQSQHVWQSLSYLNNFSFEFLKRYTVQLYLAHENLGIFTLMTWSIHLHLYTRTSFVLWEQLCVELEETIILSGCFLLLNLFNFYDINLSLLVIFFKICGTVIPNEQSRKLIAILRRYVIFHLLHSKHSLIPHFKKKVIIYV